MSTQITFNTCFDYRNGRLFHKGTDDLADTTLANGYRIVRAYKKSYPAHRVIWTMVNGKIPSGMVIDHINRMKDDNRIDNLRIATSCQNAQNTPKRVADMPKGVTRYGNRFKAGITANKVFHYLGIFDTMEEADVVVKVKREELHGEFASHE